MTMHERRMRGGSRAIVSRRREGDSHNSHRTAMRTVAATHRCVSVLLAIGTTRCSCVPSSSTNATRSVCTTSRTSLTALTRGAIEKVRNDSFWGSRNFHSCIQSVLRFMRSEEAVQYPETA